MPSINLNNYNFRYTQNGNSDELIVLVHGSASDHRTWHHQITEFGKHYHTMAYSSRYHWPNEPIEEDQDYSMAQHTEDLEQFLQLFPTRPVHLIGHSYGALLCLLLAIKNPGSIRTLTLAEPPAVALYVSNSPKPGEILKLLLSKPKLALAIIGFGAKGIAPATKAFKQDDMDRALDVFGKATLSAAAYRKLSQERLQQARANLIKSELLGSGFLPLNKRQMQNIHLPTLLISGQNSPKLWHHLLNEFEGIIPNTEKKMIPDAAHIMHEDNSAEYNATVLSFLKKHSN